MDKFGGPRAPSGVWETVLKKARVGDSRQEGLTLFRKRGQRQENRDSSAGRFYFLTLRHLLGISSPSADSGN